MFPSHNSPKNSLSQAITHSKGSVGRNYFGSRRVLATGLTLLINNGGTVDSSCWGIASRGIS